MNYSLIRNGYGPSVWAVAHTTDECHFIPFQCWDGVVDRELCITKWGARRVIRKWQVSGVVSGRYPVLETIKGDN